MPTVRDALSQLKQSVGRLEGSLKHLETSVAGVQRDMFGAIVPPAGKKGKANGNALPFDSTLVSKKLDKAIKKVEELLSA